MITGLTVVMSGTRNQLVVGSISAKLYQSMMVVVVDLWIWFWSWRWWWRPNVGGHHQCCTATTLQEWVHHTTTHCWFQDCCQLWRLKLSDVVWIKADIKYSPSSIKVYVLIVSCRFIETQNGSPMSMVPCDEYHNCCYPYTLHPIFALHHHIPPHYSYTYHSLHETREREQSFYDLLCIQV